MLLKKKESNPWDWERCHDPLYLFQDVRVDPGCCDLDARSLTRIQNGRQRQRQVFSFRFVLIA